MPEVAQLRNIIGSSERADPPRNPSSSSSPGNSVLSKGFEIAQFHSARAMVTSPIAPLATACCISMIQGVLRRCIPIWTIRSVDRTPRTARLPSDIEWDIGFSQ